MTQIVFAHGWGFDKNIWNKMNDKVFDSYEIYQIDFGYTGDLNCDLNKIQDGAVCIGHSIGFLWLLKNVKNPSALISISGFSCFYNFIEKNIIKKMKRNIEKKTKAQMRNFYRMSGNKEKKLPNFNKKFLLDGLDWLLNWDETKTLEQIKCPIFPISSIDDKIVPIEVSKQIWKKYELNLTSAGGHLLPINESKFCLKIIKRVLNDIKV